MKRSIQVHLGDQQYQVGTLRYDRQGSRESAAFEYAPAWLENAERFAVDPGLPLASGPQFRKSQPGASPFPGAISDTEPDGWGRRVILRDHAKRRSSDKATTGARPPLSPLDFLLAVDDYSRVGALRLKDEEGIFQRAPADGRRTTPPLLELSHMLRASQAVETNTETQADLAYLRGRGTSLGGLRPKCTLVDEDGALAIGKFPSVTDERAITKGEVLAMTLGKKAGLSVAPARLVQSEGQAIAVIGRFDRTREGRRIPFISAATLLGVRSSEEQHSYTEIADAIRRYGADPKADIEQLWRRIAFFILITNTDDHLLNHGFLHVERGKWRLSPAYDVNPFPDRIRELKTWISEESGPDATLSALLDMAPHFQISLRRAKEIVRDVGAAVHTWRKVGASLGMSRTELDTFADAFEHRETTRTG